MTLYEFLKFVHILAAVVWVGGALTVQVISLRVMRAGDPSRKAALAGELEWVGTRVFTPASGILLLFGIFLVLEGNWGFDEPYVGAGILIWLLSTVTGSGFLGPELGRIQKMADAEGPESPTVTARVNRLLLVSRIDLVLLVLAIFLMVVKPGTDLPSL